MVTTLMRPIFMSIKLVTKDSIKSPTYLPLFWDELHGAVFGPFHHAMIGSSAVQASSAVSGRGAAATGGPPRPAALSSWPGPTGCKAGISGATRFLLPTENKVSPDNRTSAASCPHLGKIRMPPPPALVGGGRRTRKAAGGDAGAPLAVGVRL
jgi:hypothetical protein